jgi:hypothetical protein
MVLVAAQDVAGGVLHGHYPRMCGEPVERSPCVADAGPRGDVVQHDRQVGGVGHGDGVLVDALLGGAGVVGRHDEQAVRPGAGGLLGHPHRVPGVVRPRSGDHEGPLADRVDDGADQVGLLRVVGGRRLARRAADDEAVVAVVDQVRRQRGGRVEVDRPVVPHGRDHRRQQGAEGTGCSVRHRYDATGGGAVTTSVAPSSPAPSGRG